MSEILTLINLWQKLNPHLSSTLIALTLFGLLLALGMFYKYVYRKDREVDKISHEVLRTEAIEHNATLSTEMQKDSERNKNELVRLIRDLSITINDKINGIKEVFEVKFESVDKKRDQYQLELKELAKDMTGIKTTLVENKIKTAPIMDKWLPIIEEEIHLSAFKCVEIIDKNILPLIANNSFISLEFFGEILKEMEVMINEKRTAEYTKFTRFGISDLVINLCREVDAEKFAGEVLMMQDYLAEVNEEPTIEARRAVVKTGGKALVQRIYIDWMDAFKLRCNQI